MAIETTPHTRKILGAYYSPPHLAEFLVHWAVRAPSDRILDPACGEAVFLQAARDRLRGMQAEVEVGQVTGFDVDLEAAQEAQVSVPEASVLHVDFFEQRVPTTLFDAVVGNPPYVRYHYFSGAVRERALARARAQGVELPQLSSSWAPFLVHAAAFLKSDGRLAFVLPAELLSTDYARPVREYLIRRFARIDVLTFEERIFPGAMVDAVLLLASGRGPGEVHVHRLKDATALTGFDASSSVPFRAAKWTRALMEPEGAIAFALAEQVMRPLGALATVDIGVVTGANGFFLLKESTVQRYGLARRDLRPVIARGNQLSGHAFSKGEWSRRQVADELVWLFAPAHDEGAAGAYIRAGEEAGVESSYKCSIRSPWWRMRLPTPPDLILTYMSNRAPRLVANDAAVLTTNLLHNVRLIERRDARRASHLLALSWPNSATMLSCELSGRAYGGGVLKLETREAERVLVPCLSTEAIDVLLQRKTAIDELLGRNDVEGAADLIDPVVLSVLDAAARDVLRRAWLDLRGRRKRRAAPAKHMK